MSVFRRSARYHDKPKHAADFAAVLARARAAGVDRMLVCGGSVPQRGGSGSCNVFKGVLGVDVVDIRAFWYVAIRLYYFLLCLCS